MTDETPGHPTILSTRFEIRPPDGPPIRGEVRVAEGARPLTAVVVCHGFKGFRTWGPWPPLARALAAHGHAAVTFDFSRNGVGADGVDFSALELFRENTHTRNVEEIWMIIDALEDRRLGVPRPRRIGLFGHSRGGGEAVLAAAEDRRVSALVTWAAIADIPGRWTAEQVEAWGRGEDVSITNARTGQEMPIAPSYWADVEAHRDRLDITAAAGRIEVPWLIVHGDADETVPVGDAHQLFEAAGDEAELLIVDGADHTFGAKHPYAGAGETLRTAADSTLEWFDAYLR